MFLAASSFVLMIGVSRPPAVTYVFFIWTGWFGTVVFFLVYNLACRESKVVVSKRRLVSDAVASLVVLIGSISFVPFFVSGSWS